jgi:hypothetical protein
MQVFEASQLLLEIKTSLRQGSLISSLTPQHDCRAMIQSIRPHIEKLLACCTEAGLKMSAISVRRLFLLLDPPELSEDLVVGSLEEALSRTIQSIVDELSLRLYFSFTPEEAEMYLNPLKGWDTVIGRFPKMQYNVEESAKCFALERYGAAVFHILQVAEYGVIQVGKLMGELGDKPGWSCVQRLRKLISAPYPERTPLAQQHTKLLENVVPLAIVVKDSWRHKLDHVDNQIVWVDTDFSPHVAEEIITATRGFMRKLALELPQ